LVKRGKLAELDNIPLHSTFNTINFTKDIQQYNRPLRAAVIAIGEDLSGIKAIEVGTHSIRSGAAMAMDLGECSVYTIMMIGRWSREAFLRYIRKEVKQFSHNVWTRMLKFETHRHIPEPPRVPNLDPRQHNHRDNAEIRRNVGGDLSHRVQLPAFSLFN
jgi:hypothetical protein